MKKILAVLGLFLVLGGLLFAISGASVETPVHRPRWTQNPGSVTTEGGNITEVNVSLTSLTDKWADFFGNVSGSLRLTDSSNTHYVYDWSWTVTSGGEVCVANASTFDWASAQAASGTEIDTAWGFTGTDADSGANTYTGSSCVLNFTQADVSGAASVDLSDNSGLSTFTDCVIKDQGTINSGDTNHMAFCTQINSSGKNYNNESYQYEIMVPTPEATGSAGFMTYYFYAELN